MEEKLLLDCEISVRLRNILNASDIKTFRECVDIGSENLLKYRHFGYKSLKELREILKENGYILL